MVNLSRLIKVTTWPSMFNLSMFNLSRLIKVTTWRGVLTDEEFGFAKQRVLGGAAPAPAATVASTPLA